MAFLYMASSLFGLRVIGISAAYDGPTREGTVLDSGNDGFSVSACLANGTQKPVSTWEIVKPALLKKGTSSTVTIKSGRWQTRCTVPCTTGYFTAIAAEYDGSTEAGTPLRDTNPGIHVFGTRPTGEREPIPSGWHVVTSSSLKKSTATTIRITYEDLQCDLTVPCTTRRVLRLAASYSGSTEEGAFIGSGNPSMRVTAVFDPNTYEEDLTDPSASDGSSIEYTDADSDGIEEVVTGWTLSRGVILAPREHYDVEIHYQDASCTTEIVCTTPTKEEYMAACSEPALFSLSAPFSSFSHSQVAVAGLLKAIRLRENGDVILNLEIDSGFLGLMKKSVAVRYTSSLHGSLPPEGTQVTVYGVRDGTYSNSPFAELNGAPLIHAEYVVADGYVPEEPAEEYYS